MMMRTNRIALLFAVVAIAGCHAHTVGTGQVAPEAPRGETKATRPVRTTPHAMLDAVSMRRVQRALTERGFPVDETGQLDEATERALRGFQSREKMAKTGLPDYDTLDKLGLDARKIYLGGTARKTRRRNQANR